MSRRRKHAAHVNHERWLVSYADFITLLFAFFVVMFSASQVDQRKMGRLAMAIQVAFQDLGIFEGATSRLPLDSAAPMPLAPAQLVENVQRTEPIGHLLSPPEGELGSPGPQPNPSRPPREPDLSRLQRELEEGLVEELKRGEVALEVKREGLVISLREVGFFHSGSAAVRPESEATVARIAALLAARPNALRIEGHTDNVPIHTARFASNWELSTARATEMIQLFLTRYGFAPRRLAAAGYAEYHPASPNDTPEGRQQNRRVDIVVQNPSSSPEPVRPPENGPPAGEALPQKQSSRVVSR